MRNTGVNHTKRLIFGHRLVVEDRVWDINNLNYVLCLVVPFKFWQFNLHVPVVGLLLVVLLCVWGRVFDQKEHLLHLVFLEFSDVIAWVNLRLLFYLLFLLFRDSPRRSLFIRLVCTKLLGCLLCEPVEDAFIQEIGVFLVLCFNFLGMDFRELDDVKESFLAAFSSRLALLGISLFTI